MEKIIEINAGEGGADASLLVDDLASAYEKLCARKG